MKFTIEIGESQKHQIECDFNQLLGQSVIRLNGKEVHRGARLFNEPVRQTHLIEVQEGERLTVRIEKERKWLFGQKCRVFLNNRLYKYCEGV